MTPSKRSSYSNKMGEPNRTRQDNYKRTQTCAIHRAAPTPLSGICRNCAISLGNHYFSRQSRQKVRTSLPPTSAAPKTPVMMPPRLSLPLRLSHTRKMGHTLEFIVSTARTSVKVYLSVLVGSLEVGSHRLLHPHDGMLLHVDVLRPLLEDVQQPMIVRLGPHAVDDRERKLPLLCWLVEATAKSTSHGMVPERGDGGS